MAKYNFDRCCDRSHSDAMKYCDLGQLYGRPDILPMWIADMDFEVAPEITEVLAKRMAHPVYGYAAVPADFFPSIINWLQHRHGFSVKREEITFVPGIVRALGYLVNRLTDEGDKILIQPPVYHPFRNVIVGNNRQCVCNPLIPDGDAYRMDLDGFEAVVKAERPRMFILCNPHNPIGLQWDEETLRRVAQICLDNNVTVISDEIHGDLMLHGRAHIPFLSVSDAARRVGIMLGAPSKTFNIAGLVSSWMIIKDKELRQRMFPWLEVNEFSTPTFVATEATVAAYTYGEEWLDEAIAYIEQNIDHVAERLTAATGGKITVVKPQASFLVWLDCRGLNLTHDELVDFFVNKAGLALNDGAMFGSEGEGFMRMNVAAPRSLIDIAIANLGDAAKRL